MLSRLHRRVRRRIERLARKTRDAQVRTRALIVLKVAAQQTLRAAAREVSCSPSSAWRIVARFEALGEASLMDGRRENGGLTLDEDVREGIRSILRHTPQDFEFPRPTWTLELLRRVIEQVLEVAVSLGHLCKVLHRMRVRWGRPRPVVACPWKAALRKARIDELRQLADETCGSEVLLYADEVDLHLNPKIGPDWMLPGTQRLVVTPGKNVKRYLAGAYEPGRNRLTFVEGDRKTSWLFVALLRTLVEVYAWARAVHVILDNYGIHKSRLVQAAMREIGEKIRLHFLPPYCPEENKIERIWLDLHANVTRNHRCRTIDELLLAVHQYLGARFDTRRRFAYAA